VIECGYLALNTEYETLSRVENYKARQNIN